MNRATKRPLSRAQVNFDYRYHKGLLFHTQNPKLGKEKLKIGNAHNAITREVHCTAIFHTPESTHQHQKVRHVHGSTTVHITHAFKKTRAFADS